MSSELGSGSWSVLSDRGREASGLTYEEARRLTHKLGAEDRHGLCIISNRAANKIPQAQSSTKELDCPATV